MGYLIEQGYGTTDLIREGNNLLYEKTINKKLPTNLALLGTISESSSEGSNELSINYRNYYKEILLAKHSS